jgi:DNA-binding transcriptional LysR family regulator
VHVDPLFSPLVLAPRIGEFMATHPQIEVELATRDQLGDIVAEGFDLAVRFGEPPDSSLVARKLLETRILTVASPAYLRRHGRPATPQALEGSEHICIEFRDPASGRTFPWEFHRKRKRLAVKTSGRLIVNDGGTMHSACVAGYGVAQVMEVAVKPLLESGQLEELFPDWPDERFPLYALYPSRHHPSAKVRAFLDFVIAITSAPSR